MSKHTSGPWTIKEDRGHTFKDGTVDYGGFRIDATDIEQLAYVWRSNVRFGSSEPFGAAEAEANAKLIAAAPELLALCNEMRDWLRPELVKEPDRTFFWKLHSVITKATGEA